MESKTMNHFAGLKPFLGNTGNRSSFPVRSQQAERIAHTAELFISICFILLTVDFAAYLIEHLMLFLQHLIAEQNRLPFAIPQ